MHQNWKLRHGKRWLILRTKPKNLQIAILISVVQAALVSVPCPRGNLGCTLNLVLVHHFLFYGASGLMGSKCMYPALVLVRCNSLQKLCIPSKTGGQFSVTNVNRLETWKFCLEILTVDWFLWSFMCFLGLLS